MTIINGYKPLTIFAIKSSVVNMWYGLRCVSVSNDTLMVSKSSKITFFQGQEN